MLVYSRFTIGKDFVGHYERDQLKELVKEELFEGFEPAVKAKMSVHVDRVGASDIINFTGEVAVLPVDEFKELKRIKSEYYRLTSKNIIKD